MIKSFFKAAIVIIYFVFGVNINAQDKTQQKSNISNLVILSQISVTIGGDFIVNGTFQALSTERVDQFITRIYNKAVLEKNVPQQKNKKQKTYTINKLLNKKKLKNKYALRNILLKRTDGTELHLDLKKFRLTGNFKNNPYLKNGDVLIFPTLDLKRNFIEIAGAVNKPTIFQYVPGDKLSDALLFARGINPAFENADSVEIIRLSYNGLKEKIIKASINDSILLKRADRIKVLANETGRKQFRVIVRGEVYRPGIIFITQDRTTIEQVIKQAGGFKPNADLRRAEIIRPTQNVLNSPLFSQKLDYLLMRRMADLPPQDSLTFMGDNELRYDRANISVNFAEVMNDTSQSSKVIVKDGDIIYVPEKLNLVYVYGQVMRPGYIEYSKGENYNYYLQKAGGLGKTAKSNVYLIKGKSRAWIEVSDSGTKYNIEPGDFIWIPKEITRNFDFYLERTARISAVIGAVATVILLFHQLTKK